MSEPNLTRIALKFFASTFCTSGRGHVPIDVRRTCCFVVETATLFHGDIFIGPALRQMWRRCSFGNSFHQNSVSCASLLSPRSSAAAAAGGTVRLAGGTRSTLLATASAGRPEKCPFLACFQGSRGCPLQAHKRLDSWAPRLSAVEYIPDFVLMDGHKTLDTPPSCYMLTLHLIIPLFTRFISSPPSDRETVECNIVPGNSSCNRGRWGADPPRGQKFR